jgi:hypothetical protein
MELAGEGVDMARIQVEDKALDPLDQFATPGRSVESLVELALSRIGHVGPMERFIVLNESDINLLERRLGATIISSPQTLFNAVDELADIKIAGISLQFTPPQWREIRDQADRNGVTPAEYARNVVYGMVGAFFRTAPMEPPVLQKVG